MMLEPREARFVRHEPELGAIGVLCADRALLAPTVELTLGLGPDASVFLMDDAVEELANPRLASLLDAGHDLLYCATDAEARGAGEPLPGVRPGSQYDHARMVRDATRFIALTGGPRVDDHRPTGRRVRTVRVELTRAADHPKSAQALRTAVGYVGAGLRVCVALSTAATRLTEAHSQMSAAVARALSTLRALDHLVVPVDRAPSCDLVVTW